MKSLPEIGQTLGRFVIKKRLGRSATGVVFLAEDTVLKTPVALKILGDELSRDEAFARLGSELLATRRITHPGVCKLHDLHEEGGTRFLAMDYVEGPTLEEVLAQAGKGGMPPERAVRLAIAVGEALAAAHQAGVLHRNLKPANIVMQPNDHIILMDFGLAKTGGHQGGTELARKLADANYVALEVLRGQPPNQLSDIYSLGAILYHCVTGRPPFEGIPLSTLTKGGTTPLLPSDLNLQVPQDLQTVIMTAIAAFPQARFPTAMEFVRALRDTIEEISAISSRPRMRPAILDQPPELKPETLTVTRGVPLGGTVQLQTILFSDIVEITAFFEKHGDIAGRKRIEDHHRLMFPAIRVHDGTVLKTIGDAIMASFPDADQAVDAAIRMQKLLEVHNWEIPGEEQVFIRIGINSGEAIVEYGDAYGDAVNVASRISQKAEGQQVLVSEATFQTLGRRRSIVREHSRALLKGKRDVFTLYEVEWRKASDPDQEPDQPNTQEVPAIDDSNLDTDRRRAEPEAISRKPTVDLSSIDTVFAPPPTRPIELQPPKRRRKWRWPLVILTVLLLLLLAALGFGLYWKYGRG